MRITVFRSTYGLRVLLDYLSREVRSALLPLHLVPDFTCKLSYFGDHFEDNLAHLPQLFYTVPTLQELALKRAESSVGANQANYYPQLSLNGSVGGDRADDMDFESDDFGSTLSLSLSYNLFRGGGDQARVAEAKAFKRETARSLEQQKNVVQSEVRQAVTRLEQAREQLKLQRASVKLVQQSRDLVEEGYKVGQESLARFNEVQRDLVRTQSRLALSLISLYNNREALKAATGESLIPYLDDEGEGAGMQ